MSSVGPKDNTQFLKLFNNYWIIIQFFSNLKAINQDPFNKKTNIFYNCVCDIYHATPYAVMLRVPRTSSCIRLGRLSPMAIRSLLLRHRTAVRNNFSINRQLSTRLTKHPVHVFNVVLRKQTNIQQRHQKFTPHHKKR